MLNDLFEVILCFFLLALFVLCGEGFFIWIEPYLLFHPGFLVREFCDHTDVIADV